MITKNDIKRYRTNIRAEQERVALYQALASAEQDFHLAELYRRVAEVEQRHATIWADHLHRAGATVPEARPGWLTCMLIWLAQRFGVQAVLPFISTMERSTSHSYENQIEAQAAGMPGDERSHARLFRTLRTETRNGLTGPALVLFEGRHRNTGGNAFRAAILGASDGLTTNISLVMGVAGANLAGRTILFTGIAGMLAGALSMAIGEWLSVQSARELSRHQSEVERQELMEIPEEELEELALIYEAKGIEKETARQMAERIMSKGNVASDTLAREASSIDRHDLGGSAWEAAITSFLLFSLGAIVPVMPFLFGSGTVTVIISLLISVLGFVVIGAGTTLTTGTPLFKSAGRQVLLGLLAAGITFSLGRLVGGRLG